MTHFGAGADSKMNEAEKPDVDVIIPAHNASLTIERTLRSLAPDGRIISRILLVDDGSGDGTGNVASLAAKKLKLPISVIRIESGSAGAARNAGLEMSDADFVYFIDADDEVVPGGVSVLRTRLLQDKQAGISVGMTIRRSKRRKDLLKWPRGFGTDSRSNTERFLRNELPPIAMGAAMVRRSAVGTIRFPEKAVLDEDTVFWARILWRNPVLATDEPVLIYHLDLGRMEARFKRDPRPAFEQISEAIQTLAEEGVPQAWIERRISWVSLRFARLLIMAGRHSEAQEFVSFAKQSPDFSRSWKVLQYGARIVAGRLGFKRPKATVANPHKSMPQRFMLVTHDPASPPVSGYDHRNWSIAMALAKRGEVLLASVMPVIKTVDLPEKIMCADLSGVSSKTDRVHDVRSANLLAMINQWKPDIVIFAGIPLLYLMKSVRAAGMTVVVDMHNVESALVRALTRSDGLKNRFKAWSRWRRALRHEREAIALSDQIWCCSRLDRDRLYELHKGKPDIAIVPNSVPTHKDDTDATPLLGEQKPTVFYAGHLNYLPNKLAAHRLAKHIMPLIRDHIPDAKLVLAGRSPTDDILALADPGCVEVIGNPPDMMQLLRRASVSVMPITAGGGTRIKVLECMAARVPVVATALAVEGLDIRPGLHFLQGETDAELAEQAVAVSRNNANPDYSSEAAHDIARFAFGNDAVESHVDDALFR